MGLICILLATGLNTIKGFCSKKVSGKLTCFADNVDLSLLRSLVCALLGGIFLAIGGTIPAIPAKGLLILGFSCTGSSASSSVSSRKSSSSSS